MSAVSNMALERDAAFELSVVDSARRRVCLCASGELDLTAADQLALVLEQHCAAGRRFARMDLSAVTFMDSACLDVLATAHHRFLAAHGTLILTGVGSLITPLLRVAGLDTTLFTIARAMPAPWGGDEPEPTGKTCWPFSYDSQDIAMFGARILDVQLDIESRRITAEGELDLASVATLGEAASLLIQRNPGSCIIDLAGLSFIDAAGLGCLVHINNQLTAIGATLSVVSTTPQVRKVIHLTGLDELLDYVHPAPRPDGRHNSQHRHERKRHVTHRRIGTELI